ncbi:MAG TPA: hypothetical protein VK012_04500, partial [Gemmatimonadales bacterium]|nr:hypothetical protein [Gemmatimonadales bacterium]
MAENWSREENEAAVNAYLEMLYLEIRGEQFNKAARERSLSAQLPKRGRVSQKLQNITAVLNELGVPGIEGYKPLAKYQRDLAEVVAERFRAEHQLIRLLSENVESPFTIPEVDD